MPRPGPKPRIDETRFTPRTVPQILRLHDELCKVTGKQEAWSVINWLLRPASIEGPSTHVLRSKYRRLLAEIDPPQWAERATVAGRAKGAYIGSLGEQLALPPELLPRELVA